MTRKILITGASTGIGAVTARRLASGSTLYLHWHRTSCEPAARASRKAGAEVNLLQADLSSEAGCRRLVDGLRQRTDSLDALVNNAGGLIARHDVETLTWNLMERIFALNTFSAMLMTQLCTPLLRRGANPSIVNITSIAARHGAPTATLYAASKGAVDTFTRGSARELAPEIRVNAVAPGVILTPFHDKYTEGERLERLRGATPLKFHGGSDHVAHAIEFLIDNTFTTGETIDVNGGLSMR